MILETEIIGQSKSETNFTSTLVNSLIRHTNMYTYKYVYIVRRDFPRVLYLPQLSYIIKN